MEIKIKSEIGKDDESIINDIRENNNYIYVSPNYTMLAGSAIDRMVFLLIALEKLIEAQKKDEIMKLLKKYVEEKEKGNKLLDSECEKISEMVISILEEIEED